MRASDPQKNFGGILPLWSSVRAYCAKWSGLNGWYMMLTMRNVFICLHGARLACPAVNCILGLTVRVCEGRIFFSFWQPSTINYRIKAAFQFLNVTFQGPAANYALSLVAKSFEPATWQPGLSIFLGRSKMGSYTEATAVVESRLN